MMNIGLWGVRLASFLTGYTVSDVANWWNSGDENVGNSVMYLLIFLILALVGVVGWVVYDRK